MSHLDLTLLSQFDKIKRSSPIYTGNEKKWSQFEKIKKLYLLDQK